jgi:hypothetical protein
LTALRAAALVGVRCSLFVWFEPWAGKAVWASRCREAFREHHVDTGPFGDFTDRRVPEPIPKEALKRGVIVGIAWGHPVAVAVFSNAREAAKRARFGATSELFPRPIRKGNVVVTVDDSIAGPGERSRVRAALAALD